ncbi:MAG TPA: acetamidase/formamidase family protein [Candidatus Baltobacteraceae bacterium]|nr:acetamidase/formamidase family protein [Candidatus Baltobacteraceae bacterium]
MSGEHVQHRCGGFFGCGDEQGLGVLRQDLAEQSYTARAADRLTHMDEIDQGALDDRLTARRRSQRELWKSSAFMRILAAIGPWFAKRADASSTGGDGSRRMPQNEGRVHVVECTSETTQLGVYDTTLPPIFAIDSDDVISCRDTWSHFLNAMQPGVPIEKLVEIRVSHPGHGPHSIIGPIWVNDAQPGDVLEIRYQRLEPYPWAAVFNNPGALETGLLPTDFPHGQIKYVDLDLSAMQAEFLPRVHVPLKPFQGTLGVAPPDGFYPPLRPGVTSSVPPGPHAGNVDLSEMSEGSIMYIPVWKPGALLFTGDSHAVQGDGEINLSALETRMKEMRIQVVLHKNKNFAWPIAETETHWIVLGLDKDLNLAMTAAARNAITFLSTRANMTELDAYALLSIAGNFRVTQVVDIVRGVHAMIPKSLFAADFRPQITVV